MLTQPDGKPRLLHVDLQRPRGHAASSMNKRVFQPGDRVRVKTSNGTIKGVLQTVSESVCTIKVPNGDMIEVEASRLRPPRAPYGARTGFHYKVKKSKFDMRGKSRVTVVSSAS